MFINIYRNPKTRNWFRYETFIHLFEFKGFSTWGERDTIFLCWLLLHRQLSTQPTRGARSAQIHLGHPALNLDSLVRHQELKSLLFVKSQKSSTDASGAWRHSHPLVSISIWDFYFDISEWHILILTKPKGKIYKTKSLRNYITVVVPVRSPMYKSNQSVWKLFVLDMDSLKRKFLLRRNCYSFSNCIEMVHLNMFTIEHVYIWTCFQLDMFTFEHVYNWTCLHLNTGVGHL